MWNPFAPKLPKAHEIVTAINTQLRLAREMPGDEAFSVLQTVAMMLAADIKGSCERHSDKQECDRRLRMISEMFWAEDLPNPFAEECDVAAQPAACTSKPEHEYRAAQPGQPGYAVQQAMLKALADASGEAQILAPAEPGFGVSAGSLVEARLMPFEEGQRYFTSPELLHRTGTTLDWVPERLTAAQRVSYRACVSAMSHGERQRLYARNGMRAIYLKALRTVRASIINAQPPLPRTWRDFWLDWWYDGNRPVKPVEPYAELVTEIDATIADLS